METQVLEKYQRSTFLFCNQNLDVLRGSSWASLALGGFPDSRLFPARLRPVAHLVDFFFESHLSDGGNWANGFAQSSQIVTITS